MSAQAGRFQNLWFKWKSLKLPWRRKWLAGADLAGNTFWEFKDHLNANRLRRIVQYSRKTHYADIKISPQWHQWLRHTRDTAPSIKEQSADVLRQEAMKQLAARADERWASVPSFLDSPNQQQPAPAIGVRDPGGYAQQTEPAHKEGVRSAVARPEQVLAASEGRDGVDEGRFEGASKETERAQSVVGGKKSKEDPWKRPKGNPGDEWAPQSWTPGAASKR
ncbi:hypothetical protein LTR66_013262 [Elasticomyces elasticus]|nr:hypothetical protein LTR66_013262 [Elasticomyces elasticus]KAK4979501.1 hypothetical protein LTR28_004306 [Elasticomyces elasticus]